VKIYVAAVEVVLREIGKTKMKLNLQPKLVGKLIWVPVIFLLPKIFIPSYVFDALIC
jgi:hypothetical protein